MDETRAFFAARAATWEEKFPDDGPVFAAAIEKLDLPPGGVALDAGCGTGRALPLLRAAVGPDGQVLGVDVTPEMIWSARDRGRRDHGRLLMADAERLPLRDGIVDGVLAAGLISHVRHPTALLRELARVTTADARLGLFHPVGRAVLAARHGRTLSPDDIRAEANLNPLLTAGGWNLVDFHDGDDHYLAVATK
ncbi:methyltransferase [Acrocarpospora corrugata]|uniref:Methyltransferase n=1 Tax=Acrocarpospora corrugata TaxID=35763 RepID=A0A5M3VXH1_9ACTN|nr:methyltransferase domain-containing protein [Acrocarpospora corrugata]GES00402.1 methyltransferase [Acrocarpospora corrugata]